MKNLKYSSLLLKRRTEDVIIFPFILFGRFLSLLAPIKKEYNLYFFFPFYHTGGAEKVHAQIVQATASKNCIVYFTRKSVDDTFYKEFQQSGCVIKDISAFTDNKWLYFLNLIYRGIITGYINRQKIKPVIFNGQCNFGYKISPWIKKEIRQVELIHSLNSFSYIRIPFLPFINATIMISQKRIEDHKELYQRLAIPREYLKRINYIPNAVPPISFHEQKDKSKFTVLYTGRGGEEKRVHLVAAIAKKVKDLDPGIAFEILGDVSDVLPADKYPFIRFYGNQSDKIVIDDIYANASVLILTSNTEGFPMVIIEAMMHGCPVIATPVGDIPFHIRGNETGFLFSSVEDESTIINEGCEKILLLKKDSLLFDRMSSAVINYANANFGIDQFNAAYQKILNTPA